MAHKSIPLAATLSFDDSLCANACIRLVFSCCLCRTGRACQIARRRVFVLCYCRNPNWSLALAISDAPSTCHLAKLPFCILPDTPHSIATSQSAKEWLPRNEAFNRRPFPVYRLSALGADTIQARAPLSASPLVRSSNVRACCHFACL